MEPTDRMDPTDPLDPAPLNPYEVLERRALVRTYRILTPNRNLRAASCYGCQSPLPADHGQEVMESGFYGGRLSQRFLCARCLAPIREAHEQFPPPGWLAQDTKLPDWWRELRRTPRTTEERRQLPRPGPKEIDALLAERENQKDPTK